MINTTPIIFARKYESMVKEIYKADNGYYIIAEQGFYFDRIGKGTHKAFETTQREVLTTIRSLKPCHCLECEWKVVTMNTCDLCGKEENIFLISGEKRYCEDCYYSDIDDDSDIEIWETAVCGCFFCPHW